MSEDSEDEQLADEAEQSCAAATYATIDHSRRLSDGTTDTDTSLYSDHPTTDPELSGEDSTYESDSLLNENENSSVVDTERRSSPIGGSRPAYTGLSSRLKFRVKDIRLTCKGTTRGTAWNCAPWGHAVCLESELLGVSGRGFLIGVYDDVVPLDDLYPFARFIEHFLSTGVLWPSTMRLTGLANDKEDLLHNDPSTKRRVTQDKRLLRTNAYNKPVCDITSLSLVKDVLHLDDSLINLLRRLSQSQGQGSFSDFSCYLCKKAVDIVRRGASTIQTDLRSLKAAGFEVSTTR